MLEINTAKIKNTVTFAVDKESLKEAKDAIKGLEKYSENIQPSLNMVKMKRQMREMERYAKRIRDSMHAPFNGPQPGNNGPRPSSGGAGRPAGGGQGNPPRAGRPTRQDIGDLRMENFSHKAAQYTHADTRALAQARDIIAQTVGLYQREEISLQRLNQVLAHQLDSLRRSHRQKMGDIEEEVRGRRRVRRELEAQAKTQIRIRERERKARERDEKREKEQRRRQREVRYGRGLEGALGLSPQMLGSALLGAGLFAGLSQIRQGLSASAERTNLVSRGAENVQTNPNAILTMRTWGEINGVDSANIIKSIDNIKDVRERLGNTALHSKFDEDTGKWTGGDSGINDIMNQFGWNKDQVAQFQNRPLDFVQAVVNEGQRRGLNSAGIGRLMENLGDDLMHYQRMFLDNGREFMSTLDLLKRSGAALSEEQIKSAQDYTRLAAEFSLYGEGFSNNFLTGFMDAMKNAPDFSKNVDTFTIAARELGESTGQLANAIASLIGWFTSINPENKHEKLSSNGAYYEDSMVGTLVNSWGRVMDNVSSLNSIPGVQDARPMNPLGNFNSSFLTDPLTPNPYSIAGQGVSPVRAGQNQFNAMPFNITNTVEIPQNAFNVNIIPDGYSFSNFLRSEMGTSFNSYTQGLTLQMSSGQSSTTQ